MRKKLLQIAVLLLIGVMTVGISGPALAGSVDIVSVNLQELFAVHPAAQQAQEELEAETMRLQQKLAEAEDEESAAFMQQQMQQELQMLQQTLLQQALDTIQQDIARIAEEKNYGYVVDANTLIYGGQDVTEEVKEFIAAETEE